MSTEQHISGGAAAGHTPGPWVVQVDAIGRPPMHSDLRVIAPGSTPDHIRPIVRLELQGEEAAANARLIAAAPAMLWALREIAMMHANHYPLLGELCSVGTEMGLTAAAALRDLGLSLSTTEAP